MKINLIAAWITIKKLLWCSWKHKQDRCYPEVWNPITNEHRYAQWHCRKCSPCGGPIRKAMGKIKR